MTRIQGHDILPAEAPADSHKVVHLAGSQAALGVLIEGTHHGVEGGTAEHPKRMVSHLVELLADRNHILCLHPRGEEGLVGITQNSVSYLYRVIVDWPEGSRL